MENKTKHLYRIIKRVHSKKVIKLLIQQVKFPHRVYMEIRDNDGIPEILHKTPEWILNLVDKLNKEEIKFVK